MCLATASRDMHHHVVSIGFHQLKLILLLTQYNYHISPQQLQQLLLLYGCRLMMCVVVVSRDMHHHVVSIGFHQLKLILLLTRYNYHICPQQLQQLLLLRLHIYHTAL